MSDGKRAASRAPRVLVAFDKFKGAIGAERACELVGEVLRAQRPNWQLVSIPFSDGGDGFSSLLTRAAGGEMLSLRGQYCPGRASPQDTLLSVGPVRGEQIPAAARQLIGAQGHERVMVVDMASVDGLHRVAADDRDPLGATTLGTGQLLLACARAGADRIVLGVGGSATNDLGLGALGALGLQFHNAEGDSIEQPCPRAWGELQHMSGALESLPPVLVACDVSNPLLGPQGATFVYGPQKGLSASQCKFVDAQAAVISERMCEHLEVPVAQREQPGAGAAGGLAFGLMVAAGARLVSGFQLVNHWLGLDASLDNVDIVLTGEGCFDASSWSGKGPGALMTRAHAQGLEACVLAGSVDEVAVAGLRSKGCEFYSISPPELPLATAIAETPERLQQAVVQWLASRMED